MPFFDPIRIGSSGAVADTTYSVDRSLKFNSSGPAYLSRTPSSTGNQKVWTWSAWVKRTTLGSSSQYLFASNEANSSGDGIAALYFQNDQIYTYYDTSSSSTYGAVNSRKYRDAGAWYHIVWQVDAANTTHKIWINGVEETSLSNNPINYNYTMNQSGHANVIGTSPWNTSSAPANMYLAEVHFSDGNKYAASDFAETDATTGQWVPKKSSDVISAITYGTNGYYLNFSDNSNNAAIGTDYSGNSNNFSVNNIASSHDTVKDTPTNNFCTFDPLQNYDSLTLGEGNTKATATSTWDMVRSTMGVSSGKWYFEVRCDAAPDNEGWMAGIHEMFGRDNDGYWIYNSTYTAANYGYAYAVQDNNQRRKNGSSDDTFDTGDIQAGDIVGFRMNLDDNEILISVNGSDKGKMYDIQAGIEYAPFVNLYQGAAATLNCGQDSTFAGATSSGGNTDGGGQGDFKYAVPSGYLALCSANLPDPTILLPNQHFNTLLWSGDNATSRSITGLEFSPDWVITKRRSAVSSHMVCDSVRGVNKALYTEGTTAETTSNQYGYVSEFGSNGFTVDHSSGYADQVNASGSTYVAWNWNAGDTDGKTYTVKVVSDSGNKYRFDDFGTSAVTLDLAEGGTYIFDQSDSSNSGHPLRFSTTSDGTHGGGSEYTTGVTTSGTPGSSGAKTTITVAASAPTLYYYCTQHSGMGGQADTNSTLGSSNFDGSVQSTVKVNATAGFSIVSHTGTGGSVTVGHGLGVAPEMYIQKSRDNSEYWDVYMTVIDGSLDYMHLNLTNAKADSGLTAPTSSVIYRGSADSNGEKKIIYCFSSVAGFSKVGKYTGNYNTDGTFVFTGFRPAWILFKNTQTSGTPWVLFDNKRTPHNVCLESLEPNTSDAEDTQTSRNIDILSNGFKIRGNSIAHNKSGETIIYLAFAESPFKNARAR